MKLKYRIALAFALLSVALMLMVSLIDYYWILQNTSEDFFKRLELRVELTQKMRIEEVNASGRIYEFKNIQLDKLPFQKEYDVYESRIEADVRKFDLSLPLSFFEEAKKNEVARFRAKSVYYAAKYYRDKTGNYFVVVSARNEATAAYLRNSRNVMLISVAVGIVISLIVGFLFSRMLLRTVGHINEKLKNITATQLHQRLHVTGKYSELSELKRTFNDMLDRLETSFETQKNFISNASHELNTPLTGIIGESEYILKKPRTPEEYQASLKVILNDAERLQKITGSLLHLAQTGYNGKIQEFKTCRIDELLYTVKQTVDDRIPENNMFMNFELVPDDESKLLVQANEQLLEIALTNIIMNACKYSNNKPVEVTLVAAKTKVIIIVEDNGIGIPTEDLPYIYEPFFRASNTDRFNGYGIGLPLARNIIRMHHGELEVTSEENIGTKIRITFPIATTLEIPKSR